MALNSHHKHRGFRYHHEPHIQDANAELHVLAPSDPSPSVALLEPATNVFAPRGDPTTTSTSTYGSGGNTTVIIAISVIVPVIIAATILIVLHRRATKRSQLEDLNDPHKSLDFGTDPVLADKMEKHGMSSANRKQYGKSLDLMNLTPYILPPEVNSSHGSLHSLSKSIVDEHDPYRQVTVARGSPRPGDNDTASRSSSRSRPFPAGQRDDMDQHLLHNAQPISRSHSPLVVAEPAHFEHEKYSQGLALNGPKGYDIPVPVVSITEPSDMDDFPGDKGPERSSDAHNVASHPPALTINTQTPPRGSSMQNNGSSPQHGGPVNPNAYSAFPEIVVGTGPLKEDPALHDPTPSKSVNETEENRMTMGLGIISSYADRNRLSTNRLSVMRPLPPDDPSENPEERANRIRSFYKEYFSDDQPAQTFEPAQDQYQEDYGQEHMDDGTIFDPETGSFIVADRPYAEPVTRRAMTPPPRAPPRFRGTPQPAYPGSNPGTPRGRAFSTASTSRMGPHGHGPSRRPAPPPTALRTLPTPHLLKEDAFALPIDFAPPTTYKDRAAGRAPSPAMQIRPFSPQVPIASPLSSSFNELSVMPSPHQLRKSGTFTALDFAPPPRFKNADGMSDAGSIRSGRSNHSAMSAAQVQNIRAGAYRVSRIPKELVGTRDETMSSLKPTWKLGT